jgi:toxin ParE1/3/4
MPVKFRVEFTRAAEKDFEEIWAYIAVDSPVAASNLVLALERQISTLEQFPERCPMIPENALLGSRYRHLVHGAYRTLFRIDGSTVYILRVIHGARLLDFSMFDA